MAEPFIVHGAVPYVFCADAGAIATWCQDVLGFTERGRWTDDNGAVSNVELTLGKAEVWLDGPVPDWPRRLEGLGSWIGLQVEDLDAIHTHLHGLGVAVEPPIDRGFGTRHLTVVDLEGHQWGLIERTLDARSPRRSSTWTSAVTRLVVGRHATARFVRDRVLPPLAAARQGHPTVTTAPPPAVLEGFSQLGIRYRQGALATPPAGVVRRAARLTAGPVAGDISPDAPVLVRDAGGEPVVATRLRRLIDGGWAMLWFGPPSPQQHDAATSARRHLGDDLTTVRVLTPAAAIEPARWQGDTDVEVLVEDHRGLLSRRLRPRGSDTVLVRPDGHVGWRAGPTSPPLEPWLRRVFGGPRL